MDTAVFLAFSDEIRKLAQQKEAAVVLGTTILGGAKPLQQMASGGFAGAKKLPGINVARAVPAAPVRPKGVLQLTDPKSLPNLLGQGRMAQ